jgi:MYXO-CTERM domain-containing protein
MNIQYFVAALSLAATLARLAVADVAAPETCTLDLKQTPTSECLECKPAQSSCGLLLTPYCFTLVCTKYVLGSPVSMWCRTTGADVPVVPAETLTQIQSGTLQPMLGDAGTAPSTCLPYTPPAPAPAAPADRGGDGCSISGRTRATNASLWGLLALAGLTVVRRRKRYRCQR